MPVVTVEWWEGRTVEKKKQLVAGMTLVMTKMGIPAEMIHVIIKDVPKHNWAIAGELVSENPEI